LIAASTLAMLFHDHDIPRPLKPAVAPTFGLSTTFGWGFESGLRAVSNLADEERS
jgi:hypothetical protein